MCEDVGGHAFFVVVEEAVVEGPWLSDVVAVFALQDEDVVEVGCEFFEVVVCACVFPGLVRECRGLGEFFGEGRGYFPGFLYVFLEAADDVLVVVCERLEGRGAGEGLDVVVEGVGDEAFVGEAGEERELVGPVLDAFGRHVGHLVPAEEGADAAEQGELFLFGVDV